MKNSIVFGILIVAIAAVGAASLTTILGEVIQIVSAEEQGDDQGKIFLAKNKGKGKHGNKGQPGPEGNSGP